MDRKTMLKVAFCAAAVLTLCAVPDVFQRAQEGDARRTVGAGVLVAVFAGCALDAYRILRRE